MTIDDLATLTYYRGRVGLRALLAAVGVGKSDKVATQAFTCLAVPEAILAAGATPQWIDIEPGGVNMDPADLERRLTPDTRAIVVQHTFGVPARIDELLAIAQRRGIPLIEDCCHTLDSVFAGQRVGTFGVGAFYSFEWGKPIIAGIGGAAIASSDDVRRRLVEDYARFSDPGFARILRIQAQYLAFSVLYRPAFYWPLRAAFRMLSAVGAAEGNYNGVEDAAPDFRLRMAPALRRRMQRKLRQLSLVTSHARDVARAYGTGIQTPAVVAPIVPDKAEPVYARYPLFAEQKSKLLAAARDARVELSGWYATPIHPLRGSELAQVAYEPGECPVAESAADRVVSLPTSRQTDPRSVQRAIALLNAIGR